MIVPQPPNSPICNIKDACIFTALSKAVLSIQATICNIKMLHGNEFNTCVQQVWIQLLKTTILRIYLHQHQILATVVLEYGGDDFMTKPGGFHRNIDCHLIPIYDEENCAAIGIFVCDEPLEPLVDK